MQKYGVKNNIAYYRMVRNMNQRELGDKIHFAPETICKYETGATDVLMRTAKEIADVLDVTLVDLFAKEISEEEFKKVKSEYRSRNYHKWYGEKSERYV